MIVQTAGTCTVKLARVLKATPSRVFAALTDPAQMLKWWGPGAGPTVFAEADVRPGGRYSIVFLTEDGQRLNPTGIYKEVIKNEKLVFTWEWPGRPEAESVVTITLRPVSGGTQIALLHELLPNKEAADSHKVGWGGLLTKLKEFCGG